MINSDDISAPKSIPVVDIAGLKSTNLQDRLIVSKAIDSALRNFGFMYIKNHGVDKVLCEKIKTISKLFFELREEEKMEISISKNDFARG